MSDTKHDINVKLKCRCYIYTYSTFYSSLELLFTLISDDGALLSCGDESYGLLGRDGEESEFLPVEMSFMPVSIAAGPCHSLAICQFDESNGVDVGTTKIASWGWNRHYELGRESFDELPDLVDGLDGENPISISVGLAHSLAVTSNGKLWVWGSGLFGKLGFASPEKQPIPYYLDSLEGFQVLTGRCWVGSYSSVSC